jgi:predicted DsbA family dithiol-disulfide isomerase
VPLTSLHPHAATAARAATCGETLGKGDEMAAVLISAPPADLTDDGCTKMAVGVGLDENAFRTCLAAPETQKKIESDEADFKAVNGHGLPMIWIGKDLVEGAQGPDRLREAMDKAVSEAGG